MPRKWRKRLRKQHRRLLKRNEPPGIPQKTEWLNSKPNSAAFGARPNSSSSWNCRKCWLTTSI